MPNERLRVALLERGLTPSDLAAQCGVDPKSVERWITQNRLPYRKHRFKIAAVLGVDEAILWPDALSPDQVAAAAENEILAVYPHRWAVPPDIWGRLFTAAREEIGILVYSGLFLAEDAGIQRILQERADAGARVRILIGDPDSPEVAERGQDERIGDSMAAKIRNVLVLYRPLLETGAVEIRAHRTVLYNSLYRADDQLLVNAHVYGTGASNAPVLHLRRVAGGDMVTMYVESFDRVWAGAVPYALP